MDAADDPDEAIVALDVAFRAMMDMKLSRQLPLPSVSNSDDTLSLLLKFIDLRINTSALTAADAETGQFFPLASCNKFIRHHNDRGCPRGAKKSWHLP